MFGEDPSVLDLAKVSFAPGGPDRSKFADVGVSDSTTEVSSLKILDEVATFVLNGET